MLWDIKIINNNSQDTDDADNSADADGGDVLL